MRLLSIIALAVLIVGGYAVMAYSTVRAPTAIEVHRAMQVRGVTPGQPFPYDIGGQFWRLKHFGVSVHGSHVILDLDVEPM